MRILLSRITNINYILIYFLKVLKYIRNLRFTIYINYCYCVCRATNRLVATGVMFAPALRHVAPSLLGWNRYVETCNALEKFVQETIARHEETLDTEHPR